MDNESEEERQSNHLALVTDIICVDTVYFSWSFVSFFKYLVGFLLSCLQKWDMFKPLPGIGDGLVVDSGPVLFAALTVVHVVAQDLIFVFGLLPLKQHRGVCVSGSYDGVRRSWNG